MSKLLKIILFIILIIGLSLNMCYGIDENINTTENEEVYSTSTTISSVSNVSNNSTVTNILIIALIVIGVLLILLAIAILIRLGK